MLVRRCINMFWKRGRHVEDVMTGMRAMSPLFVKSFPILSQGFEIETEMTIFPLANSFRITSMPIQYRDRPEGSFSKLKARSGTASGSADHRRPVQGLSPPAGLLDTGLSAGRVLPGAVPARAGGIHVQRAVPRFPSPDCVRFLHAGGPAELCLRPDSGLPAQAARQAFEIQLNVLTLLLRQERTAAASGGDRPARDEQSIADESRAGSPAFVILRQRGEGRAGGRLSLPSS